ncbi:MAG: hypothetical protein ACH0QD_13265 [Tepidibacillus sp.]
MMESVKKIGRLHEIKKEREELKQKIEELTQPLMAKLISLDEEEQTLRGELAEDAFTNHKGKLSFLGLGSVSVSEKEEYVITDEKEALAIALENPAFLAATDPKLNKKKFLEIALETYKQTGDLVSVVKKQTKRSTRITLAQLEENAEN